MTNQNLQIHSKTFAKLKFAFQASAFSWSNFWHFEFSSSNSPNDHHHSTPKANMFDLAMGPKAEDQTL